ncbi:MAG: membrane protein insertion efficiency factor YidD [Desulfobacterales bacterium]|nr:membrane protein insertion efficiency factor YidD [Desulfobacterales bacterium]
MIKIYISRKPGRIKAAVLLCMVLVTGTGCAAGPHANGQAGAEGPLNLLIKVYQGPLDHLNAVRTGQCPMHPSCSNYAQAAINKHGTVLGWMLACDRLIRCGKTELDYSPKVPVNGKWKYYDPVSANDFWFSNEGN